MSRERFEVPEWSPLSRIIGKLRADTIKAKVLMLNPQSAIRNPKSNGFTLIEAIMTLVILSIAAVGVLSVFTVGIQGSANPLIANQAIQLAQGEMDQVMGEKMANGFNALAANASAGCVTPMLSGDFVCSRTICFVPAEDLNAVTPCDDTPAAGKDYKYVTVTITHALIGSVTLDTVISNY